jgi:hypothetical protein
MKMSCVLMATWWLSGQVGAQQMPSKADKQFEMGMYQEAAVSYQASIQDGTASDIEGYERLAECYMNINRPFEAVATYEEAAMKYDMSADSYTKWASALKKIGRIEEANEIASFASIKGNKPFVDIAIADDMGYDIQPVAFNSRGNEFAPAFLGEDIICVTDNYNSLKVTGVSTNINELPHVLMRVNANTGQKERLRGSLKDYINDGPTSYSDDGSMVCFSKGHFPAAQSPKLGNKQSGSIYMAETDGEGDWDVMMSLPCNELGVANIYPYVQEDGQRVYFASNREGGFGGFDIYYTDRMGDGFSAPKNMGPKVNTEGDEISPSVDGKMLFFASNKLSGFGGYDLFSYDQQTNVPAVNMGEGVNTNWDDYALITKNGGQSGYFTSNRPGAGGEDIYKFNRTAKKSTNHTISSTSAASAKPTNAFSQPHAVTVSSKISTTSSTASTKPTDVSLSDDLPTFKIATANSDPNRIKTIYTIQVAALSENNASYKTIASKLQDIGLVYKVYFHNVIKIRVGQFDSESEARSMLEKVKARGYNDAFVVKEELIREDVISTTSAPASASTRQEKVYTPAPKPPQSVTSTTIDNDYKADIPKENYDVALANITRYRIKLGSYTDISTFDDSVAKRYGSIFKEEEGEWTKVYLGDYMTLEDAEAIRVEVQRSGFSSANIYGIRDNEMIKIK